MHSVWSRITDQLKFASSFAGLSMGIALGLMPKVNLSACLIFTCLTLANQFVRRVIIATAIAFVFSGVVDSMLQQLGNSLFSWSPVRFVLTSMDAWPILPWFRLNSPAVLGSLIIGQSIFIAMVAASYTYSTVRDWLVDKAVLTRTGAENSKDCKPSLATHPLLAMASLEDSEGYRHGDHENVTPIYVTAREEASPQSSNVIAAVLQAENQLDHIDNAVASVDREDYSQMEIRESIIEIVPIQKPVGGRYEASSSSIRTEFAFCCRGKFG